jgi:hypothetical protein
MEILEAPGACEGCLVKDIARALDWPCSECAGLAVDDQGQKWVYPWPPLGAGSWDSASLAALSMPPWPLAMQ